MSDDNQITEEGSEPQLNIPEETMQKFPDIIDLIKGSESMNNEERQYWIDVLPIMTDDQMENLQNILDNEKKQIEEAEHEYQDQMQQEAGHFNLRFNAIKYKERKRMRLEAEKKHEIEEKKHEEALLAELENI